ncbi:MAG: hypothetical protein HDT48_01425 [Ruminococcaceae bacterium]|nr:hypothetical protein [Oscillospiraceae bacterium]
MSDEEYKNKVLILDGLDEVCVLKSEFDGYNFIENLSKVLRTGFGRNIRIIITSRMGYFNKINRNNYVDIAKIFWEEDSVIDWCAAYCKIHNNRSEWCESFKKSYTNLEKEDKRKEVFCTPLILYICCVSQVDISIHNSIASIYDEAFNVIGARQYNEWAEASKEEFEINRQFTKELAFQMFLNDKLEDVLHSNFVQIAKKKVMSWTQEKHLSQVKELEFEKLFTINHFAYGKNDAIEFVHKTIGEYFTAVKLYEDYFEHIDGTVDNTWCNIFNAFRYKTIPVDIMQYLIDLILSRQDSNWIENFFKAYYIGFNTQSLLAVTCFKPGYSTSNKALINQVHIAFRNLTWLLTGLGFNNSQFISTKENTQILYSYIKYDINFSGWKNLEHTVFSNSDLRKSIFKGACLKNSIFIEAFLTNVDFNKAILEETIFINTNLAGADLSGANLKRARLMGADLKRARLIGADLKRADLSGANLLEANLTGADLTGAHIIGAEPGAEHTIVSFIEANLIEVNATETVFKRANLTGANLTGAVFKRADLTGAVLTGANLTGVDFTGAVLKRANLAGADLSGANLTKAVFKRADLTGADLTGADLTGVDFTGAVLKRANLAGADLTGAILTEADLTGVFLTGAILTGTDLASADLK